MSNRIEQPVSAGNDDLATRLRAAGVVLCHCNCLGDLIASVPATDDWLGNLISRSPLVREGLRRLAHGWAEQERPALISIIPGLWCQPIEILRRKKRTGYALILIPTEAMLTSEHFHGLCQSAKVDYETTVRQLECHSLPSEREAPRLGMLARWLFTDSMTQAADQSALDGIGQQLADSYEEISLLYAIGQSMTVAKGPQQFLRDACAGLRATMPYKWVGAQFVAEIPSLPQLEGHLIASTNESTRTEKYTGMTRGLLQFAQPDAPVVLDPEANSEHAEFAPLGIPILVQPIIREGKIMGVLFASGKMGRDRAASSVDLKLLGATATHAGIFLENAALYEDMDAMFIGTVEAISAAIDAKDPYTRGHSQRVAHLSQQLAHVVGLDEESIRRVHVAGLVHDVGKIGVPEFVLGKPGRLTEEEFNLMKQHPEIGYRILKDIPQLRDVLPGVLHHHERWDGCGYPHGLTREEIPLYARLIALADSFDAMSSTRTYRAARDRNEVFEEIKRCAGTQFDPELAARFLGLDFSGFDDLIKEYRENQTRGEAA